MFLTVAVAADWRALYKRTAYCREGEGFVFGDGSESHDHADGRVVDDTSMQSRASNAYAIGGSSKSSAVVSAVCIGGEDHSTRSVTVYADEVSLLQSVDDMQTLLKYGREE